MFQDDSCQPAYDLLVKVMNVINVLRQYHASDYDRSNNGRVCADKILGDDNLEDDNREDDRLRK